MSESVCSQASAKSSSNVHTDCPYCPKAFQFKSLFHHIRVSHPTDFLQATQMKWIEEAETGKALKVYWETQNDFGDTITVIVYGCLASDKCFATEERANRHFKHNPADLKKHNAELRKLKRELTLKKEKEKKEQQKKLKETHPAAYLFQQALREKNPKLLEAFWRGLFHWKVGCDLAISLGSYHFKENFEYQEVQKTFPWPSVVSAYTQLCRKAQKKLEEDCDDIATVWKLYERFWAFLEHWKDNYKKVSELDIRLDCNHKDSIVFKRDEYTMDAELFYLAKTSMPMPTVADLAPPPQLQETPVLPPPEPITKEEVFNKIMTEKDIKELSTSISTGKIVEVPELKQFQKNPSFPKPSDLQLFTASKPYTPPPMKLITITKRPPKQV